jgi:2,4-didehydro-3-deoxy-L-rhamnonate hydrolase
VRRQTGNTRTQIFGVAHIMSYLSRFMALQAGDVIATGTPPGVGLGHKPPLFLKAGDRVELDSWAMHIRISHRIRTFRPPMAT